MRPGLSSEVCPDLALTLFGDWQKAPREAGSWAGDPACHREPAQALQPRLEGPSTALGAAGQAAPRWASAPTCVVSRLGQSCVLAGGAIVSLMPPGSGGQHPAVGRGRRKWGHPKGCGRRAVPWVPGGPASRRWPGGSPAPHPCEAGGLCCGSGALRGVLWLPIDRLTAPEGTVKQVLGIPLPGALTARLGEPLRAPALPRASAARQSLRSR